VSEFEATADPALWKPDKIDVPVLVVLAKSPFWTDDYLKFVRDLAPKAEIETFDGVSHFLMLDKPQEFNRDGVGLPKKESVSLSAPATTAGDAAGYSNASATESARKRPARVKT
jgi:hypothetical protein